MESSTIEAVNTALCSLGGHIEALRDFAQEQEIHGPKEQVSMWHLAEVLADAMERDLDPIEQLHSEALAVKKAEVQP